MPSNRASSQVVGENVARIRKATGVTAKAVADRMTELGVSLSPSGVSDIEAGRRTVSVDQLTCLAVVLDVSPVALLNPYVPTAAGDPPQQLTGTEPAQGEELLRWLQGTAPLDKQRQVDSFEVEHFRRRSLPPWAWTKEGES